MTSIITLNLSEQLIEQAKRLGDMTQRDIATVITDTLEIILPTLENQPDINCLIPLSQLSDDEVLTLANMKMNTAQNQRLGQLQEKGKTEGLIEDERYELLTLIQIYQLGQLRKSEALAEAVKRGLCPPLLP